MWILSRERHRRAVDRRARVRGRRVRSEEIDLSRGDAVPGNDLDAGGEQATLPGGGHDESPPEAEILHALPQAGQGVLVHRGPELDLDGQDPPPLDDEEVDLGTGVGAP